MNKQIELLVLELVQKGWHVAILNYGQELSVINFDVDNIVESKLISLDETHILMNGSTQRIYKIL